MGGRRELLSEDPAKDAAEEGEVEASVALAVVAACALAAVLASSSAQKAALLGEPFDSNLPVQRGNLKEFPDKERAGKPQPSSFWCFGALYSW